MLRALVFKTNQGQDLQIDVWTGVSGQDAPWIRVILDNHEMHKIRLNAATQEQLWYLASHVHKYLWGHSGTNGDVSDILNKINMLG